MLSNKNKIAYSVLGALLLSSSLSAEVSVSGSAGASISHTTNQFTEVPGPSPKTNVDNSDILGRNNLEADISLGIDGSHDVNSIITKLNWHLGADAETTDEYIGFDQVWVGLDTVIGEFRFGQQSSNLSNIQGSYGGNLWDSLGANEEKYARSIFYATPTFYDVTFTVQGDIGGRAVPDKIAMTQPEAVTAYATEFALNYDSEYFRADLAYYRGENSGSIDSDMGIFGELDGDYVYATSENTAQVVYAGGMAKYAGFTLGAGYSFYFWEGTIGEVEFDDINLHKMLVSAGYVYSDHEISFAFTQVFDSEIKLASAENSVEQKDSIQSYSAGYTYNLSEAVSTYVTFDHYMLSGDAPSLFSSNSDIEDMSEYADNVSKVKIGISVDF